MRVSEVLRAVVLGLASCEGESPSNVDSTDALLVSDRGPTGDALAAVDALPSSDVERIHAADVPIRDTRATDLGVAVDGADLSSGVDGAVARPRRNVLLIIADDLGIEAVPCMGVGQNPAPMPNITRLCESGVRFTQAWSEPLCSPTRSGILTGRTSISTGVGDIVGGGELGVPGDAHTLPRALGPMGYATANLGKWHLGLTHAADDTPRFFGYDHFSGFLLGGVQSYWGWRHTTDGVTAIDPAYMTTVFADEAIEWLGQRGAESWFLWLAFNAPHAPFHLPPPDLHTFDHLEGAAIPMRPIQHFHAMIEALDHEVGRVLDALTLEQRALTVVVFVGDNGSVARVAEPPIPAGRSKQTLFQGGLRVPLLITTPDLVEVNRAVSTPVHTRDLYASVLEWTGALVPADSPDGARRDSVSLVPLLTPGGTLPPRVLRSELFGPSIDTVTGGVAVRDEQYKLIRTLDGTERLFDLLADPWETSPLDLNGEWAARAGLLRDASDTPAR